MIAEALLFLRPGAEWSLDGDTFEGIIWHDKEQTMPTRAELDAALVYIEQNKEALNYAELRRQSYPSIGDQLDSLYHAGIFPKEMSDRIKAVKDRYPKPAESVFSMS